MTVAQSSFDEDDQPWCLKLLHGGQEPIVKSVIPGSWTVTISYGASLHLRSILAVHGVNGHREETWTGDEGILWPRDLLPSQLPNARISAWGYDSRTHTKSYREHLTHQEIV